MFRVVQNRKEEWWWQKRRWWWFHLIPSKWFRSLHSPLKDMSYPGPFQRSSGLLPVTFYTASYSPIEFWCRWSLCGSSHLSFFCSRSLINFRLSLGSQRFFLSTGFVKWSLLFLYFFHIQPCVYLPAFTLTFNYWCKRSLQYVTLCCSYVIAPLVH